MKKTTIQLICLVLALILPLGMAACSKEDGDEQPSETTEPIGTEAPAPDNDPEQEEPEEEKNPSNSNITPKRLYAARKGVRLIGPRARTSEDCMYLDFPGQGFEVSLNSKDGKVNFVVNGDSSFLVSVDGVAWKNADGGLLHTLEKSTFIQLTGLSVGDHVIRVIKADSSSKHATISAAVFDGTILETASSADKALYVEFVGDNTLMGGSDVSASYPYLVAEKLNSDYMITTWSEADVATGDHTVETEYGYLNPYEAEDANKIAYNFARQANAVVLSVGKNDTCDAATFEAAYVSLIKTILQKNGGNTKFYCVYDAAHPYGTNIEVACASLGGADSGLHAVNLTGADEAARAEQLATLIQSTVNLPSAPIGASGIGTVVDWKDGVEVDPQ